MSAMGSQAKSIGEYIAAFPPEVQRILEKVRATIRRAAPGAEEAIKYRIPTFTLDGNLVHFAAYKTHIGLYPAPRGSGPFKKELAGYAGGKGTVRFPLDEPIPYDLIRRIARFRVEENRKKAAARAKAR